MTALRFSNNADDPTVIFNSLSAMPAHIPLPGSGLLFAGALVTGGLTLTRRRRKTG